MTPREIAEAINRHARECLILFKPTYDVVDRGEAQINAAILAERERCAKVAEGMWHALHKDIAAAIRKDPTNDPA